MNQLPLLLEGEGVEYDAHFASDTFLWSAYNVSVAADAAKAS